MIPALENVDTTDELAGESLAPLRVPTSVCRMSFRREGTVHGVLNREKEVAGG
jgi:hypothetical protein